ncbi:ankyrin-3-like isoform X1 [Carya illinoinensis]|uniref:ankyrin-3-like isoform X1 n=2 Tax=Carya illinoinensis TaxID=32201 RepID=UPI001C718592|nr:ankyrin-3-like isoform X1 [Carya illinoinensis]
MFLVCMEEEIVKQAFCHNMDRICALIEKCLNVTSIIMPVSNLGFSVVLCCFELRLPQLVIKTLQYTMDPIIYKAAAHGNLEALEQYHISDPLDGFLTVNKNTIIHICISSILVEEDSHAVGGTDQVSAAKFVKDVLDKCPSLLLKANTEDDTPLHVAARYGHASIVKVLIEHQKSQHQDLESGVVEATTEMIGKLNKERDTALHEAVCHNHIEVVKQLLTEVDPEFPFGANVAGETPLYLAAERRFPELVSEILNELKSPAYDGPLGRTALHAAAFYDNDGGMTKNILERYGRDLCKQADQNGWTPLHMAAYFNKIEATKLLLKCDREVAYMKDAEGRTALHIAARRDCVDVTVDIISMCPDCCEVVDNEGRNALHLAVHNWSSAALIIQNNSSLRNLLNQKDNDGNTPLHHYCNYSFVGDQRVLNSPRVDKMVFNKKNQNACQILESRNLPDDDFEFPLPFPTQKGKSCNRNARRRPWESARGQLSRHLGRP